MTSALYSAVLKRYTTATTHRGRVPDPTHESEARNRPCGDFVTLTAKIGDTIDAIAFEGEGCAICMAATAALCAAVERQPRAVALHEARALTTFSAEGELAAFNAARAFPSRHGCVSLAANLVIAWLAVR